MKKKPGTKLAIAIAIIQRPAVQEAAKKIGKAGLRKAQAWWQSREAPKRIALEKPKVVKKSGTARKKKPAATKKKTAHKGSLAKQAKV